jgi:polysaccharide biosynthesis/export protein
MLEVLPMKLALFCLGLAVAAGPSLCLAQAPADAATVSSADTRAGVPMPVARTTQALVQPIDPRTPAFRPAADAPQADAGLATPLLALGKEYRLGANDLLEVEVLDLENGKRNVRVNAAGLITMPLIGSVVVAGLTAQEAENLIASRYREKYLQNPQVSVFIKEYTSEHITVEGAVIKPGIYPLTGKLTLLRALALAGGFGQIANSSEVMLFRQDPNGKRQVAVFDVDEIRSGKHEDPAIRGEDLIVVQRDAGRRLLKDSIFRDIVDSINPFSVFSR